MNSKTKKQEFAKVGIRLKVVIDTMELRNKCPKCNSDFIMEDSNKLITHSRFQKTFICQDCGRIFAHVYKLVYDQSFGIGDE